jgi:hypothetical protein
VARAGRMTLTCTSCGESFYLHEDLESPYPVFEDDVATRQVVLMHGGHICVETTKEASAQWDGREPYVSPSGSSADGVLPCGRLGCFADFTGSCCIYCGKETP